MTVRVRKIELFFSILAVVVGTVLLVLPHLNQKMQAQAASVAQSNRLTVVLDPGHGGFDGGAQSNGINEKELNLAIADKERLLCQLFGFQVVMTRDSDVSIHDEASGNWKRSDMHKRLDIMTAQPQSVTVSIHLNKFEQASAKGAQVFYAPKSPDSDLLAQTIQDSFKLLLQPENKRQIKKADKDLYLLYNNTVTPAVLVECGFISNPGEAEKLKESTYQDQVAMTICYALMKFQNRGDVSQDAAEIQSQSSLCLH